MSVRTPELEKYIEAEPATVGLSATRLANLSRLIEGYVGDRKISGAIAAVVRRRKLVHFETYGNMDDEPARPMAADTMFRLFSMTKPITAVGLMSLYEEGRFSLDDAVSRYIPSFKRLKVLDSGEPDDYVLRNPTREMTIKDVLCHTAGLAEVPGAGGQTPTELLARIYFEAGLRGSRPARTLAEMMAKLAELPLAFDPGTRWMYSSSFDVAAHLCELIANRPYDQFLEERIFRPLGMTDTCFVVPESKRSRLAANYRPGAPGEPGYVRVNPPPGAGVGDGGTFFSGSGGLIGTASDYLRFARMLANDGNLDGSRILAPRTVRFMTTNQLPGGCDIASILKDPRETGRRGIGYGLGCYVTVNSLEPGAGGADGEYFHAGAASTQFFVSPSEDLVVLFMTQLLQSQRYPFRRELEVAAYQAIID